MAKAASVSNAKCEVLLRGQLTLAHHGDSPRFARESRLRRDYFRQLGSGLQIANALDGLTRGEVEQSLSSGVSRECSYSERCFSGHGPEAQRCLRPVCA